MFNVSPVRVFISYAGEDQPLVDRLSQDLKNAGALVWYAPESLPPAVSNWQTFIRKRVKDVDYLLYVASKKAARSPNVLDEIESAKRYSVPIIAFWWQGDNWQKCRPNELVLQGRIDARRGLYASALGKLLFWLELTPPSKPSSSGERRSSPDALSEAQSPFDSHRISSAGKRLTPLGHLTDAKIDAALKKAELCQTDGRVEEAIAICESLIAQDVFRADVYYLLGCLYQAVERWSDATRRFLSSRYDPRFAILSCFRLGQCAVALSDKRGAVLYFDEAINQLNTDKLKERDADQLVQMCYEAALAHRDISEVEAAEELFQALLHFLNGQRWEAAINQARRLMSATLRYNLPLQTEQRPLRETRPLREKLPQRPIDALEYFEGPEPGRRGPVNLRRPDESGVWRTPPKLPVVNRGELKVYTLLDESDNDTRPVEIVELPKGEPPEDVLADAIDRIFGAQGSLHAHLDGLPINTRAKVSRGLREVDSLIRSRLLTAARNMCIDLITLAPHYHDITVALAEIYVRQGIVEKAIQQYVELAQRCVESGERARAIAIFQRLLQLDATSLSYRNRLNELLAQQVHEEQPVSEHGQPDSSSEAEAGELVWASADEEADPLDATHSVAEPRAGDSLVSSDTLAWREESLEANSLVDPDVLPQWVRDAQHAEDEDEINSLKRLPEDVPPRQDAAGAGQIDQLAALVQRLRSSNQLDRAAEVLSRMSLLAPNDPSVYIAIADVSLARNQIDGSVVALHGLADLYSQQGANAEAAQTYQRMAEIAWSTQNRENALSLQRLAIRSASEDSSDLSMAFRQRIVGYCLDAGHLSEAVEQQVIVARSYFERKLFRPAISALLQLLMLDRTYEDGYDMLGQSYQALGETEHARHIYLEMANLDPSSAVAQRRLQELLSASEEKDRGGADDTDNT